LLLGGFGRFGSWCGSRLGRRLLLGFVSEEHRVEIEALGGFLFRLLFRLRFRLLLGEVRVVQFDRRAGFWLLFLLGLLIALLTVAQNGFLGPAERIGQLVIVYSLSRLSSLIGHRAAHHPSSAPGFQVLLRLS
jgi:hypothetical protein